MRLYGEERGDAEIREFVLDYKRRIEVNSRSRYPQILELAGSPAKVLDYGCGWGAFSKLLEEAGHEVVGIDLDNNQIAICEHVWDQTERLRFERAEIATFDARSFDCVVSNEVIEHVHNAGNYLVQINRVLADGGRLVISLPNVMTPRLALPVASPRLPAYLMQVSEETRRDYRKGDHHINAWDPVHFVRLVSTLGFALDEYRPLEGIPLPHGRYARFRLLRHLSYSMAFAFTKVEEASLGEHD